MNKERLSVRRNLTIKRLQLTRCHDVLRTLNERAAEARRYASLYVRVEVNEVYDSRVDCVVFVGTMRNCCILVYLLTN
jgi:hypothetical protein